MISPERLWLLSIALRRRGHWVLAFSIEQLNTVLYHNSLAPGASVSPDVFLGHYSHGIVIHNDVVIGRRGEHLAKWQPSRCDPRLVPPAAQIVVEDGVSIGANAVVIPPRGSSLRIGRGARVAPERS